MEDFLLHLLKFYQQTPQWLQRPIGELYRKIPNKLRYGAFYSAYGARIREFMRNTSKISEMQQQLLFANSNRAIREVPFYQRFSPINNIEQFRQLPIVCKKDYVEEPSRFLSNIAKRLQLKANTGGSSGTPMTFYLERYRTRPKESAHFHWFWGLWGYRPGDKILMLRGKSLRNNALYEHQTINNCLNISCYELNADNLPEVLEQIRRFAPSFIHAYPSALNILVRHMRMPDCDTFKSLKAIFLGSEYLDREARQKFEAFFATPVCSWYGHSECAVHGGNLPGSDQLVFFPFYGYLELLADNGEPVTQSGESGRIVVTSFDNAAMPFIRYDTADRGVLGDAVEFQGAILPALAKIEGRNQDFIFLDDGNPVTLTAFIFGQHMPQFEKILEFQLEQKEKGEIEIRLVPLKELSADELHGLKDFLEKSVSYKLCVKPKIVAHIPKTVRGKHRFLIQHLKSISNPV